MSRKLIIADFPNSKCSTKKHKVLYDTFLTYANGKGVDQVIEPFAGLGNFFLNMRDHVDTAVLSDFNIKVYSLLMAVWENPSELIEAAKVVKEDMNPMTYYQWRELDYGDSWKELRYKIKDKQPFKKFKLKNIPISKSVNKYLWNTDYILVSALSELVTLNCSSNGSNGSYRKSRAKTNWIRSEDWKEIANVFLDQNVRIVNYDATYFLRSMGRQDGLIYADPPNFRVANEKQLYGPDYSGFETIEENKELKEILERTTSPWLVSTRDCREMRNMWNNHNMTGYNLYNKSVNHPELVISSF